MKINFSYILAALVLFLGSCEKAIDLGPLDQLGINSYWKTSNDLKNYTLQFYPQFSPATQMVEATAGHSDDMITASISTILNGERAASTGTWTADWEKIRNINIFFENYHKCEDAFETYQHYVGEAHFFRAWFYFDLVKKYGDLPWYGVTVDLDDNAALMKARDPRTLVVDSILADLDKATEYLSSRSAVGNNTITREGALAFKSRVALYEGSWQKYHANTPFGTTGANPAKYFQASVDAAQALMAGPASLYSTGNPEKDYFELFGKADMSDISEVILYRAFNAAIGRMANVQRYITYINANGKGVTWNLVSSYLGRDGEPFDYLSFAATNKGNDFLTGVAAGVDPRFSATVWIPGDLMSFNEDIYFDKPHINMGSLDLSPTGFQVKKTGNPYSPAAGLRDGEDETGFIILRMGEVLLNYAEALYELNGTVAFEALNQIRSRVGMPDFAVNNQSDDPNLQDYGYPVSDELYEIRRERRVELALEGQRDEDLMRWAAHALFQEQRPKGYPFKQSEFPTFSPSLDANGLIDYYQTNLPQGYSFREDQDYLYSIPQQERVLNPNLTQNPGW